MHEHGCDEQMRELYDLDNIGQRHFDNPAFDYMAIDFHGSTGRHDNQFIVVDRVGVYDIIGLRQAITCTDYLMHRLQVGSL